MTQTRSLSAGFVMAMTLSVAVHAEPTVVDPALTVRTVVTGLNQPVSMAFIAANDFFVLEKATGQVKRVVTEKDQTTVLTVLDLAVNFASERGLLGIALHPNFPSNPGVYLFWTCSGTPPPPENPFSPVALGCGTATGADTNNTLAVPLLGNRVDRFVWDGTTLLFDRNLIQLLAFQNDGAPIPPSQGDAGQPPRGNNDGGVIRFGPDGKLYVFVGDLGRRGWLQNLPEGPLGNNSPDDQFGGPAPDNAHLSGVVLRLNDDGTAPSDNPFFNPGATIGGEVGANLQKIFSYGHRNSFGMAFAPSSGELWLQENGDDSFTELNRVRPGMNGGWVQVMGPIERVGEYRSTEMNSATGLQQERWPPTNIATTPRQARERLFMLPGAHYVDPELSWKFDIAPAGIGFMKGGGLGREYDGDLFVGASTPTLEDGYLLRVRMTRGQRRIQTLDPLLKDGVADNTAKFDDLESESLIFGSGFGIGTDVQTGPNGNLFVVSLSDGAIYEVLRADTQR